MTLVPTPSCQQQKELSPVARGKISQLNLYQGEGLTSGFHFGVSKIPNIGYREGMAIVLWDGWGFT